MKIMGKVTFLESKLFDKLDEINPLIEEKDLIKYANNFKIDLLAALHNQKSSLPTILNPIHKMMAQSGFGVGKWRI